METNKKRKTDDEKEAQKEAKIAERKRKQEEKEEEKKRKKEEREANRRKSKEESLGEVSVVLDSAWAGGGEEGEEVVSFLIGRGVQTRMEDACVANSAVWMRNKGDVEVEENHLLVKLEAKEVGDLVVAGNLLNFAKEIKQRYPKKILAFLVQGMDYYLKQQSTDAAKDYRKMVQSKMGGKQYSEGGVPRITKAKLDEALVWLQLEASCNIKMTNTTLESADYLYRLSAAIAYAPYRPQSAFENFCAEAVRKKGGGNNMQNTWVAQLEQMNGVSNTIARAVVSQYPTIKSLTDVYLYSNLSDTEKEILLQDIPLCSHFLFPFLSFRPSSNLSLHSSFDKTADIRIENNMSGSRRLGGALSKKIYLTFTSQDPAAVIH